MDQVSIANNTAAPVVHKANLQVDRTKVQISVKRGQRVCMSATQHDDGLHGWVMILQSAMFSYHTTRDGARRVVACNTRTAPSWGGRQSKNTKESVKSTGSGEVGKSPIKYGNYCSVS